MVIFFLPVNNVTIFSKIFRKLWLRQREKPWFFFFNLISLYSIINSAASFITDSINQNSYFHLGTNRGNFGWTTLHILNLVLPPSYKQIKNTYFHRMWGIYLDFCRMPVSINHLFYTLMNMCQKWGQEVKDWKIPGHTLLLNFLLGHLKCL